jgi:hypothetical protein
MKLIVLSLVFASGCTFGFGEGWRPHWSIGTLAPGDDVQSRTSTLIGTELQPIGPEGPSIRLGYVRHQGSRVPAFEDATVVPNVLVETNVQAEDGAMIGERLKVGDLD